MRKLALALCLTLAARTTIADADVGISKDMLSVTLQTANGPVEINRIQDTQNTISGE